MYWERSFWAVVHADPPKGAYHVGKSISGRVGARGTMSMFGTMSMWSSTITGPVHLPCSTPKAALLSLLMSDDEVICTFLSPWWMSSLLQWSPGDNQYTNTSRSAHAGIG